MAPKRNSYKCGMCMSNIGNHACIMCDLCSSWVHSSCANISDDDLKKMEQIDSASYICEQCKSKNSGSDVNLRDEVCSLNKKFDYLCSKFDDYISKGHEDRDSIKQSFRDAVSDIKHEFSSQVKDLKEDIVSCSSTVKKIGSDTNTKLLLLEAENNALYKKFNRADIIINGLPDCLSDVSKTIIDLAAFYKVTINVADINQAIYLGNKKAVLVKLNRISLRDNILDAYFKKVKTQPLLATHFVSDENIPSSLLQRRVFLNEHFSPATGKLNAVCLKLRRQNIINKFKVVNALKPYAVLTMPDKTTIKSDINGCNELLKKCVPMPLE